MDNILLLAVPDVLSQESTLKQIMDNTLVTALNTKFGVIALISFIAALISAVFAVCSFVIGWKTMKAQISTEKSTKGGKNVPSTQNLMLDMVRHLYRNFVVTYAIRERMREKKFKVYPSEIHLKKMRINLDNIDLHIFLDKPEDYMNLSKLYLLIRNYHYELEVINEHLKDKMLDIKTKEMDLNTLLFKCDFITRQIINTLVSIWPDSNRDFVLEAKKFIADAQNTLNSGGNSHKTTKKDHFKYRDYLGTYYLSVLFSDEASSFVEKLNNDIAFELDKNPIGCNRIQMIDLL